MVAEMHAEVRELLHVDARHFPVPLRLDCLLEVIPGGTQVRAAAILQAPRRAVVMLRELREPSFELRELLLEARTRAPGSSLFGFDKGMTPLHFAMMSARCGEQELATVVDSLLEAGADPNAMSASGVTPLARATPPRAHAAHLLSLRLPAFLLSRPRRADDGSGGPAP